MTADRANGEGQHLPRAVRGAVPPEADRAGREGQGRYFGVRSTCSSARGRRRDQGDRGRPSGAALRAFREAARGVAAVAVTSPRPRPDLVPGPQIPTSPSPPTPKGARWAATSPLDLAPRRTGERPAVDRPARSPTTSASAPKSLLLLDDRGESPAISFPVVRSAFLERPTSRRGSPSIRQRRLDEKRELSRPAPPPQTQPSSVRTVPPPSAAQDEEDEKTRTQRGHAYRLLPTLGPPLPRHPASSAACRRSDEERRVRHFRDVIEPQLAANRSRARPDPGRVRRVYLERHAAVVRPARSRSSATGSGTPCASSATSAERTRADGRRDRRLAGEVPAGFGSRSSRRCGRRSAPPSTGATWTTNPAKKAGSNPQPPPRPVRAVHLRRARRDRRRALSRVRAAARLRRRHRATPRGMDGA